VIIALMFLSLLWWNYWFMLRAARSPQVPPVTTVQRATHTAAAIGLEGDPGLWRAARGAWTVWDEHQLIRLLTDSAPLNEPALNSADTAVPQVENKDIP
jgi:hypothetical protein